MTRVEAAVYVICLPFYCDQASIVMYMTSWVRKLPNADRWDVVVVIVIARAFKEVHILEDVI